MKTKFVFAALSFFAVHLFVGCAEQQSTREQSVEVNISTHNEVETNIGATKKMDKERGVDLFNGYLIYKTKSCIFRRTDPPYPPGAPCAQDSGYIVLSDNKDELETDPESEKTILKEDQVLVFYVPDSVINILVTGEIYQIRGAKQTYDGHPAIKYVGLEDGGFCEKLEREVVSFYSEANHCKKNADCVYRPSLAFREGCTRIYNRNADLTEVKKKEKLFYDLGCPFPEVSCDVINKDQASCKNGKCVLGVAK